MSLTALFFLTAAVLLIVGVPIASTVGAASMAYIFASGTKPLVIISRLFSGIDTVSFVCIPMFILAGDFMNRGGLAKRIVRMCSKLVGNVHGGLALVTIIACMFFAAISGSGVATAAAMGAILIPSMVKSGYSKRYASAVVASASPIGVIIPPSISFIVYGVLANVSITALYKGGIPSGILMGLCLMAVAFVIAKKRGYKGGMDDLDEVYIERDDGTVVTDKKQMTLKEKILDSSFWALLTPIIILGGVFGGICTATESAVIAVLYSMICGLFIYKGLKWKDIPKAFVSSAIGAAKIMFVIANAQLFAYIISFAKVPQAILSGFNALNMGKIGILLLINLILLIAGTFMETSAIILICTPIFLPVVQKFGMNPVHFGILITVNTAVGLLTPPFGVCLFTSASVARVKIHELIREIFPFFVAMVAATLIITFCEPLVMCLQ